MRQDKNLNFCNWTSGNWGVWTDCWPKKGLYFGKSVGKSICGEKKLPIRTEEQYCFGFPWQVSVDGICLVLGYELAC